MVDDGTLSAQAERVLRALSQVQAPRSKGHLAIETYGADNASTRSMISRLSNQLTGGGLTVERKSGRERLMELTDAGRAYLRARENPSSRDLPVPTIPPLDEALDSLKPRADRPLHPLDRPRFHLRHAALLCLAAQHKSGIRSPADEHFEMMLRTLVHDAPEGTVDGDQRIFASLASTWPNDWRKRLIGCVVEFQDPQRRRKTGPEFVTLGDRIDPGPEAVLWASGAIDLAHHYSFAAASQIDRMTARRLLQRAKHLLEHTLLDPTLRIAAEYRLGKIAKVAQVGWIWDAKEAALLDVPHEREPADHDGDDLHELLRKLDQAVVSSGRFNFSLEACEQVLRHYLGRWVMLAFPSSEWVFRGAGGVDIAAAIEEWAIDMRERGVLRELLTERVKDEESAPLRKTLQEFIKVPKPSVEDPAGTQLEPYLVQAKALLGQPVKVDPEQKSKGYYHQMLMNNLWNPEMVAAHTVAAAADGG
jgi:hypothetical protein